MSLLMLTIFKYLLLILIYLFLLYILLVIRRDLKSKEKELEKGKLTGLDGPLSGQSFTFSDSISIGRGQSNNLILDDQFVSLSHALISKRNGHFFIQDLKSTNGTYLNGARINKPAVLKHGDTLRVGKNLFQFEQENK